MPPVDPNKLDSARKQPPGGNGTHPPTRPMSTSSFLLPPEELPSPAAAPALPPARSATPTAVSLLKALRRRWLLALVLGLILGGLATVAMWYTPVFSKSGAYALVKINATPTNIVFAQHESVVDYEKYQKTQAVQVKSQQVLKAALAQPQVAELPVVREQFSALEWLERDLTADFLTGPEILRISLKGDKQDQLAIVVGAVATEYLREAREREKNERNTRYELVNAELTKEKERLRTKQLALKQLMGPGDDGSAGVRLKTKEQMAAAEKQLDTAQTELMQLQIEQEARQKRGAAPPTNLPDYAIDDALNERMLKDPLLAPRFVRKAQLEAEIADIERLAAVGTAEARSAKQRRELEAIDRELSARKLQMRDQVVRALEDKAQGQTRMDNLQLEQKIAGLKKLEELLKEKLNRLGDAAHSGKTAVDLDWLQAEITQTEGTVKKVEEKAESLRIELGAPSRVELMQEAVVAPRDDRKQMQLAGMAGIGMFAAAVFGISWVEFRARRVSSLDEVSQGLGMKLLGAVPKLPERVRRRLGDPGAARDFYWHNLLTESVDVTRTLLVHQSQTDGTQVVMVTSALEGEGKTSLASQLAASLARSGRKTLLIDCDLRKPAMHKLFDLPLEPGLSEVLRGEVHLSDAVRPTRLSRLWLIAAGIWDAHATQALAQENVQALFEDLRGQFDFIVIDSSPVLPVADTLLIGQHVDGVVFSILRDQSRLPRVYAAYQRLAMLGVRMLGAVVHGARGDSYGSEYQQVMKTGN
jgi:succinoglycan biosynthesis transport protein ExoP